MAGLDLDGVVMAGVALGLFWIHILLISGAALLDLRDLARVAARASAAVPARVRAGLGPQGLFARNYVDQLGRLDRRAGPARIHFHDRTHASEVFGGTLELADGSVIDVPPPPGFRGEVWPDAGRRIALAGAIEDPQLAIAAAGRAKGFERRVETPVLAGERVWCTIASEPMLVALADPRAFVLRARLLVAGFAIGNVLVAALCTLLALWPPHFELVSMIGAAGALGWFLAVQPLGVAVHDAVRSPDRAFLRGRWDDSPTRRPSASS